MPKKAAFFLGSGISYASYGKKPSGEFVASVDGITESAFNEDWHYTSCRTFAHGKRPSPYIPDDVTSAVQEFLKVVRTCADDYNAYLSKPRKALYEDLFSLAEQASQPQSQYIPNLAVVEFLRRLKNDTRTIHTSFRNPITNSDPFVTLAQISCD